MRNEDVVDDSSEGREKEETYSRDHQADAQNERTNSSEAAASNPSIQLRTPLFASPAFQACKTYKETLCHLYNLLQKNIYNIKGADITKVYKRNAPDNQSSVKIKLSIN